VGLDKADMFALGATMYELATGSALPTGMLQPRIGTHPPCDICMLLPEHKVASQQ
jgi:hypothetical protein